MARGRGKNAANSHTKKRPIEPYEHKGKKRVNNPPVGLVTPETDPPLPTQKVYDYIEPVPSVKPGNDLDYDAHLDPQLVWAGKKEHASFEVPTVSLHVHDGRVRDHRNAEPRRARLGEGPEAEARVAGRFDRQLPQSRVRGTRHARARRQRQIGIDAGLTGNPPPVHSMSVERADDHAAQAADGRRRYTAGPAHALCPVRQRR